MKFGEKATHRIRNLITGETHESAYVYKRARWQDWHTDREGDGLWHGDKQIVGLCQFTVRGCKTQKAANAKVRNAAKQMMQD